MVKVTHTIDIETPPPGSVLREQSSKDGSNGTCNSPDDTDDSIHHAPFSV